MNLIANCVLFAFCFEHIHCLRITESIAQCCNLAEGICRELCQGVSFIDFGRTGNDRSWETFRQDCHGIENKLWRCINSTIQDVLNRQKSRPCCSLAKSSSCHLFCLEADSSADVRQGCRSRDEKDVLNCIEKKDASEKCCKKSKTRHCFKACQDYLFNKIEVNSETSTNSWNIDRRSIHDKFPLRIVQPGYFDPKSYDVHQRNHLSRLQTCKTSSPHVLYCLEKFHQKASNNSHPDLVCCQKASNSKCRKVCEESFLNFNDEQEVFKRLTNSACGPPLPGEPLWKCFLQNSEPHQNGGTHSKKNTVAFAIDYAKLGCCARANSMACRQICIKTFSTDWNSNWEEFHLICLENNIETNLKQCINDAEKPCQQGCHKLNFCSNFNGDGVHLFRSCDIQSDIVAQKDLYLWKKHRALQLPQMIIPITDISTCEPNLWKALACISHIKPCHETNHQSSICMSDCLYLVGKCVDAKRIPYGHTSLTLCNMLAAPTNSTCLPLSRYNDRKPTGVKTTDISLHPCASKPCKKSQVCVLKDQYITTSNSSSYECLPGCSLGQISEVKVTQNTYVNILSYPYRQECMQICKCSRRGRLEKCHAVQCEVQRKCWYKGREYAHDSLFENNCNTCYCWSGKLKCTKMECKIKQNGGRTNIKTPGFSCDCPDVFSPVCGINGKTFFNGCIARKCFGLEQYQFTYGECFATNPCNPNNPCESNQLCIPKRRICLTDGLCPQYECVVEKKKSCFSSVEGRKLGPVCDVSGKEHPNICDMLESRNKLDYWFKCMKYCDHFSGLVCGIDGETYSSDCSAAANDMLVDYFGPCLFIGPMTSSSSHRCKNIKCKTSSHEDSCIKVIPPGACCPVCASVFRLVINKQKLEKYKNLMQNTKFITVNSFINRLKTIIRTSNCRIYGHLDIYGDLLVTVIATSQFHHQICHSEATRISTHLRLKSPVVVTDALLSTVITSIPADVVVISNESCSNQLLPYFTPVYFLLFLLFQIFAPV